jgi:hypothetical protein
MFDNHILKMLDVNGFNKRFASYAVFLLRFGCNLAIDKQI